MPKQDLLALMDQLLKLPRGTVKGTDCLHQLAEWDSLAIMGFIALADEKFGVEVSPFGLERCGTVDDLIALLAPASVMN
jgi:acyl carrier protein